jgi:predicted DNA-binding antitoxin AbrB/MazE fold protein
VASYPNLRARYSKGTLKLNRRLNLPEGAEVRVSVTAVRPATRQRRSVRRRYAYPSRPLSPRQLGRLTGAVALGGDALADSETLYDGQ